MNNEIDSLIEKQSRIIKNERKYLFFNNLLNIIVFCICFSTVIVMLTKVFQPGMVDQIVINRILYGFLNSIVALILIGRIFHIKIKNQIQFKESIESLRKIKNNLEHSPKNC